MKLGKRITSIILALIMVLPIATQLTYAEDIEEYDVPTVSYILEAENTSLNSNRSVEDDAIASNNEYLHIQENNSRVFFNVPSDLESGTYTITVTAKHPYGYKENYVNLNGERIGTIVGDSSQWQDYSFTNQTISANDVIEIELYWGWFDIDSIKLVKTGTASEIINTYRIEADRMELNDSYDIIDSSSASGEKCVRAYQYTDFKFSVPANFAAGIYDITVVARHPYGYKKNYLCVNEKQVGIIEGESYNWTEYIFESQTVNPNDVIELQMEWGWFDVDYIKITPAAVEHTYSFEAEQATLSNDYLLADDETASNGIYVKIKQNTFVEFTMPSDFVSGTYNVTLKSRYPNGYKKNYMNLNGSSIATLESSEANWVNQIVSNVNLKAGDVISLSMEWGYFDIDTLTVSNEYYGVELNTENLEYYEAINAYFTESDITAISGTLNRNDVQSMKYRLTDKDGNKISSGSVDVSSNWSVPVELTWGYNTFTTTIICNDNKVYQKRFEIFNGDINDADQNDDDNDGLLNYLEDYLGTDKNNADCDNDGLTDYEEVFIFGTSPLNADSDDNGVIDGTEDYDGDGLTNADELRTYNTDPTLTDTDGDGLSDYEEIFTYLTNPNMYDTDEDGLSDGEEVKLGLNPNLGDSNNDGIPDGEEKIYQSFTPDLEFREESPVTGFTVAFAGTGDITERTTVADMLDIDVLSSSVVGLIGSPYEITTSSTFDEATITFTIDQEKLGETSFADLGILWYDEENDQYVIIDSTLNEETSTVSATVSHFSEYMVIDKSGWVRAWAKVFNYIDSTNPTYTVLAIDCSGSMYSYDYISTKPYSIVLDGVSYTDYKKSCHRISAGEQYVKSMNVGDKAGVVAFDSYSSILCSITDNKEAITDSLQNLWSSGGTSFNSAVSTSIGLLSGYENVNKNIILMSDGESSCSDTYINQAISNGIKIYTLGFGNASGDVTLQTIANRTGGKFFKAVTGDELERLYYMLGILEGTDLTDSDNDGIPDIIETTGMRTQSGQTIQTDPNNPDCDGDGLLDGEEILCDININKDDNLKNLVNDMYYSIGIDKNYNGFYFTMKSNPLKADNFYFEKSNKNYYSQDSMIYKTIATSEMSKRKNASLNLYSLDGDESKIYSQSKWEKAGLGKYKYYLSTYEIEYKTKTDWINYINKKYYMYNEWVKPSIDTFSNYGEAGGTNDYLALFLTFLSEIIPDRPAMYNYISSMCIGESDNDFIPICLNVNIDCIVID